MTGDFRGEILLIALVFSALAHVGTMLYAKPRVMTHSVAASVQKIVRRGPMKVTRDQPPPPPVKIDEVEDVTAPKDAPEAMATAPRAPDAVLAESRTLPALEVAPPVARPPEPEDKVVLDEKRFAVGQPKDLPQMPKVTMALPQAPAVLQAPAQVPAAEPFAPRLDALAGASGGRIDDSGLLSPTAAERKMGVERVDAASKAFVPVQTVTEKVDAQLVEREKEAVRELIDQDNAAELAKFVNVAMTASTVGPWTYFKLLFTPRHELQPVAKDMVVLIDASGSIGKDRMRSIREATQQILRGCLNSGDRFNLVAFRDKYDYASRQWMNCDRKSFDFADGWLGNLTAHGRTDVFATISSVLTLPRDPARPLIALVVTDGEANSGVRETADILSKFTALNDGLVSVYMYGVKNQANRELIDVLTHGNRGESVIYDGWLKWRTGSQLESLTNRFRDPVLSDIRIVFAADTPADAYPRRIRNLYRGDTLEIVGRVPAGTKEVAFSVKGLNGKDAYESFQRLALTTAPADASVAARWEAERAIDAKLGGRP